MSLADFIVEASGGDLEVPWHLGKYFELAERLTEGGLHVCVSVPPQHGKTLLVEYAIAHSLHKNPKQLFGYGSYAKLFSSNRTEEIRDIFIASGGSMKEDHNRKDDWRTAQGGGCIAFSPGSAITGYKMNTIVFDDFVHDEMDLDTEQKRHAIKTDIERATQRLWVGGSVVGIGTRWHPEDPIGVLLAKGYDEVNLPAIREDDDGNEHALWPNVKPLEWLNTKRQPSSREFVGEYAWATQYQGKPIPPTGAVFGPPRWYDTLPAGAEIIVIGFDMGYGPEGSSDYSVAVALAYHNGIYYVHDVRRVKTTLDESVRAFKAMMGDYPYPCRYGSYVSGPEKGFMNHLFQDSVAIERMPARHNKWSRAQRTAAAWRTGRILVRRGQPWASKFVREVEYFTGEEKGHDDQVDALVSGFDLVEMNAPVGWAGGGFTFGKAVM